MSDIQQDVLQLAYEGCSYREIASKLGGKSASTVRNHRFHLRRCKREAKKLMAKYFRTDEGLSLVRFPRKPNDSEYWVK